jgi:hypothetical protein
MKYQMGFLLKLLLLSTLLSILVKYSSPSFLIPPTVTNALLLVLLPTLILAIALCGRFISVKQN